jgi:hypothetical protein
VKRARSRTHAGKKPLNKAAIDRDHESIWTLGSHEGRKRELGPVRNLSTPLNSRSIGRLLWSPVLPAPPRWTETRPATGARVRSGGGAHPNAPLAKGPPQIRLRLGNSDKGVSAAAASGTTFYLVSLLHHHTLVCHFYKISLAMWYIG